jgi:flavin-binding protein dodecin
MPDRNPFVFAKVVGGREFCNRVEMAAIQKRIESGQSIALIGPRRTGKTSAIHEASKRAKMNLVYVDLLAVKDLADIVKRILDAMAASKPLMSKVMDIAKQIGPSVSVSSGMVDEFKFNVSLGLGPNEEMDTLEKALRALGAVLGKRKDYVIAFDEFQEIMAIEGNEQALAALRSRIQFMSQPFVFSGSVRHQLNWIFRDMQSPFYNSVTIFDINPIPRDRLEPFLIRRFEKSGLQVTPEAWDLIWKSTDGISGNIQQLCAAIYDFGFRKHVAEKQVELALQSLIDQQSSSYADIMRNLPTHQAKILAALAHHGGREITGKQWMRNAGQTNASSVKKSVTALVKKELVWIHEKTYRVTDSFMGAWLRMNYAQR